MAVFDYTRITEITRLGNEEYPSVLVTNTTGKKYIRNVIIHNTYSTDVIIWLFNVSNETGSIGVPNPANQFLRTTLVAYDTLLLEIPAPGIMLVDQYDSIQGYASVENVVTIQMYGGYE
jgi:hypothetical protein